jgi:hypothetical protein
MTDKNTPITPAYLVDVLADWARADAQAQHPATTSPDKA